MQATAYLYLLAIYYNGLQVQIAFRRRESELFIGEPRVVLLVVKIPHSCMATYGSVLGGDFACKEITEVLRKVQNMLYTSKYFWLLSLEPQDL